MGASVGFSAISENFSLALDYDADGNLLFQGLAQPGTAKSAAEWRVKKFFYDASDNLTDIQFADGNKDFDNIWDNRATLSYS